MITQYRGTGIYPSYNVETKGDAYCYDTWLLKRKDNINYLVRHRDSFLINDLDPLFRLNSLQKFHSFMDKSRYLYKVDKKYLREYMLEVAPPELQGITERQFYINYYSRF